MSNSEKPLKIISFILSGLLIASALFYFVFGQGAPVEAEVVMEYSAPAGFDPSELLATFEALRTDEAFLKEVAVRSGASEESGPEFARTAAGLARNLVFKTDFRESSIAIRFTHRKSATAVKVATAVAIVAKENLEQQLEERASEIIRLADAEEDKRKLLKTMRREEALNLTDPQGASARRMYRTFVDLEDYERTLRRLTDLKAKPEFSIVAIHPATLLGD